MVEPEMEREIVFKTSTGLICNPPLGAQGDLPVVRLGELELVAEPA